MIEPANNRPTFSVIIPFRDPLPEFRDCLDAILQEVQRYGSAEIIAVDNGSQDSSADLVRAHPSIRLFSAPDRSIGGVRNVGAKWARGIFLYFLDADCLVPANQFNQAAHVFEETGCSATGCKYGLGHGTSWVERSWVKMHKPTTDGPASYINSGNLFVTSRAFGDVGGFDEAIITGEDTELCFRLRRYGHTVFQSTQLSVSHLGNPNTLTVLFRREIWHGLGMFGTGVPLFRNRVTIMLLAHLILVAGSIALAVSSGHSMAWRLWGILAGNSAVPLASVGFRYYQNRLRGNLLARMVLYWVYYLGRAIALVRIIVRRVIGAKSSD